MSEKQQDPLEGKTIDELKKMVADLLKQNEDNTKKLNTYTVMIQATIIQLKESGLDLQVIGRNMQQTLEQISNPNPRNQPPIKPN